MGFLEKLTRKKKDASSKDLGEDLASKLNEEKRDMIRGVVDLSETSVKEVMIPRIDVDFLPTDINGSDLLAKISESGHSRFPVYGETIDNVIGVLYVKDLINLMAKNEPVEIAKVLRKPFFVPETKRIDALLREFKHRHLHIAIAVDEYGGVSGIVCMEDIIEEIVGDIQDEFDNEREDIIPIGEGVWLCDAHASLDDLSDIFGDAVPGEEFDTLGGFVFDLFGKIPVRYEKVCWNNFEFVIQDMDGHRINTVKIIGKKDRDAGADENAK